MNAEDLDLCRERILQLCRAANHFGLKPDRILRTLQRAAFDLDGPALERELRHLRDAGLIKPADAAALTPALISFTTTAAGNHELEKRGLLP